MFPAAEGLRQALQRASRVGAGTGVAAGEAAGLLAGTPLRESITHDLYGLLGGP